MRIVKDGEHVHLPPVDETAELITSAALEYATDNIEESIRYAAEIAVGMRDANPYYTPDKSVDQLTLEGV